MNSSLFSSSRLGLVVGSLVFGCATLDAQLAINIQESGKDTILTWSGSLNTANATTNADNAFETDENACNMGAMLATSATLCYFKTSGIFFNAWVMTQTVSNFGTGSIAVATTGTATSGYGFMLQGYDDYFALSTDYTSGSLLSGSLTWSNATIDSLGLTPGTYTFAVGNKGSDETITLTIASASVPEPSVYASALGLAAFGLAVTGRKLRRP
jgi:hypothetical protein